VRRLPLYGFVGLVYLFLFAPIVLVVVNSLNADPDLIKWGGFTLKWFDQALSNDLVVEGIRNSLLIAGIVTAVAVVVGTLAAIGLRNAGRGIRIVTDATTYSRLIMPELVLAIGLLLAFRAMGYPLGMVTVTIGHAAFYTAYVILIVSARLSRRDRFVEEAARDLGATPLRALVRVTLPEVAPAVATAGLLVFAFSMDNIITSLFLSSGLNTLPLVLFTMIHTHITPEVNAIGALMIAVSAVVMLLFFGGYVVRGASRRRRMNPRAGGPVVR
jgi:spermidine/putrescine transport system permease protein